MATIRSNALAGGPGSLPLERYDGPQNWYGRDMAQCANEWTHRWTAEEIAEIEAAFAKVDRCGLDILDIRSAEFPLPKVANRLAQIKRYVLHGPGFFMLRGLPIESWTNRQAAVAYWGMGMHIGQPCSQNGEGHVLGHVKNLGLDYKDPLARGYQTNARLAYHTDSSDIVGLLCYKPGKSGGLSSIVSSTTVYNEMVKRRPDLVEVMMHPFQRTRWGEIPEGKRAWAELPVFMPHQGRLIVHYVRSAIRKGQLIKGVKALTDKQIEALDFFDNLTGDSEIHLDMEFRPGDIQLLCNHSILHSRTAFLDYDEPEKRRHLLRLWLACEDGPPLPTWMTDAYEGKTSNGRPNGIQLPGVPFKALLDAE